MPRSLFLIAVVAAGALGAPIAAAQRSLVVHCSHAADACELANRTRNLILPANAMATIRPEAARFADVAMLDVDPAKFGQPEERRRLLARWQREIGDTLR